MISYIFIILLNFFSAIWLFIDAYHNLRKCNNLPIALLDWGFIAANLLAIAFELDLLLIDLQ